MENIGVKNVEEKSYKQLLRCSMEELKEELEYRKRLLAFAIHRKQRDTKVIAFFVFLVGVVFSLFAFSYAQLLMQQMLLLGAAIVAPILAYVNGLSYKSDFEVRQNRAINEITKLINLQQRV